MVGQPERVARAQQQHRPPVEHHARPLRSGDHPHALVQPELVRARPGGPRDPASTILCPSGVARKRTGRIGRLPSLRQRGGRFSMKARTPSAKSSERKRRRAARAARPPARGRAAGSARAARACCRAATAARAPRSRAASATAAPDVLDDLVHEAPRQRVVGVDRPRGEEQLARAGGADRVDEAPQARVRVDDARAAPAASRASRPGAHTRRSHASASSSPPPKA